MTIRDATARDLPSLEPLWRVQLEVAATNEDARALYARWGFKEQELTLATPLDELAQRVARSR